MSAVPPGSAAAPPPARRVYPLDAHSLTEEQIAVAFAMTSRRPEPFDAIAEQVSREQAADFHERWVLGYGHASVAEHAVVHLAVENISRLAADALEDHRLASYTEKSSRYQVMGAGDYHIPAELDGEPALRDEFAAVGRALFDSYARLMEGCLTHLRQVNPLGANERDAAYQLRLRRRATDDCRAVLPAATLTNVGVTANARTLEHAISKLLSSGLREEHELGRELRDQARKITPTLIKYAERNEYLADLPQHIAGASAASGWGGALAADVFAGGGVGPQVRLVHWDEQAEEKLAAALLYRSSALPYAAAWQRAQELTETQRRELIGAALQGLGPHDAPPREFELVDYTFEYLMDYGAFREFRRHRMQTYLPQSLTVAHGYRTPPGLVEAGLEGEFAAAMERAADGFRRVGEFSPAAVQYLVTHAHNRRVLSKLNLRECYHLFKLRTSPQAHPSIREPMQEALRLAQAVHPQLFSGLQLRG